MLICRCLIGEICGIRIEIESCVSHSLCLFCIYACVCIIDPRKIFPTDFIWIFWNLNTLHNRICRVATQYNTLYIRKCIAFRFVLHIYKWGWVLWSRVSWILNRRVVRSSYTRKYRKVHLLRLLCIKCILGPRRPFSHNCQPVRRDTSFCVCLMAFFGKKYKYGVWGLGLWDDSINSHGKRSDYNTYVSVIELSSKCPRFRCQMKANFKNWGRFGLLTHN